MRSVPEPAAQPVLTLTMVNVVGAISGYGPTLGSGVGLADRLDTDRAAPLQSDPDLDRSYRRLTRQQRAVIALHYEYGYTIDECAHLIGCAPGTARSHLARALTTMRKDLQNE